MNSDDIYELALKKIEAAEKYWSSKSPKDREKADIFYQEARDLREQFIEITQNNQQTNK
jgi:hypothetical protein